MTPTIQANAHFDADKAAEALRKAMKGVGTGKSQKQIPQNNRLLSTDEKAIIEVLTHCNTAQRVQIAKQFKVRELDK